MKLTKMEDKKIFLRDYDLKDIKIRKWYTTDENGDDKELIIENFVTGERIVLPVDSLHTIGMGFLHMYKHHIDQKDRRNEEIQNKTL